VTNAKRLLEQATPLPWDLYAYVNGGGRFHRDDRTLVADVYNEGDRDLIAYAVNRLPDYEAAVEALERLVAQGPAGHKVQPWPMPSEAVPGFAEAVSRGELHPTCSACSALNNDLATQLAHESWEAWDAARVALARLREQVHV
jgi:hypothetical protein